MKMTKKTLGDTFFAAHCICYSEAVISDFVKSLVKLCNLGLGLTLTLPDITQIY